MAIAREDLKEILRNEVAFEFSHIPSDENAIDIHFSQQFSYKMDRLLMAQQKTYWKYVNTFAKRVAIVCFVAAVMLTTACSIDEIREPIVNFVKEIHEKFIQYFVEGDTTREISYEYNIYELPEGFKEIEVNRSETQVFKVYKNNLDETIEFTQAATQEAQHYYDIEQGSVSVENVGGIEVEFYMHKELITSIWIKDTYLFELTYYGNGSKEQIKQMIMSIE